MTKPTIEQLLEEEREKILKQGDTAGESLQDARHTPVGDIDFEIAASYTQDAIVALLTGKEGCNPTDLPTWFECYQPEVLVQGDNWEQWPEVGYAYIYTGCNYQDYKLCYFAYYFYYSGELGMCYSKETQIERPY